jgi:hypothetical protein
MNHGFFSLPFARSYSWLVLYCVTIFCKDMPQLDMNGGSLSFFTCRFIGVTAKIDGI